MIFPLLISFDFICFPLTIVSGNLLKKLDIDSQEETTFDILFVVH
ncbi:MAG: hypothetical protein ACJA2N_001216 [Salibacteraceae bacterium]|jgi:hypothetical protein